MEGKSCGAQWRHVGGGRQTPRSARGQGGTCAAIMSCRVTVDRAHGGAPGGALAAPPSPSSQPHARAGPGTGPRPQGDCITPGRLYQKSLGSTPRSTRQRSNPQPSSTPTHEKREPPRHGGASKNKRTRENTKTRTQNHRGSTRPPPLSRSRQSADHPPTGRAAPRPWFPSPPTRG